MVNGFWFLEIERKYKYKEFRQKCGNKNTNTRRG
jgi:hypothetical protein